MIKAMSGNIYYVNLLVLKNTFTKQNSINQLNGFI